MISANEINALLEDYLKSSDGQDFLKKQGISISFYDEEQLRQIAETKLPDLNAYDVEAAMKIVEGTARNMGVAVKGLNDAELAAQAAEAKAEEIKEAKREAELAKMEAEANEVHEVEVIGEDKENEE